MPGKSTSAIFEFKCLFLTTGLHAKYNAKQAGELI